jgi:serine/threonine-protein kinase
MEQPSADVFADGRSVGPYQIVRKLGAGGMATVYLALDPRHNRSVALKVLHPYLAEHGAERFHREIQLAAGLGHPHILPLFDSGEIEGRLFYVMPYVPGESLRDRLRRENELPLEDSLRIGHEVADALAYAHEQGIIHRDIKPENILLTKGGGHALVADFGIARALEPADRTRLTDTGMAVGTVAYMSPEQASGATDIDGRTDIYSLGCVLFEMLAGEPPHTGPTPQAILVKRIMEAPPSVRRFRSAVPPAVEYAITRALAPVPADRFQTMAELRDALPPARGSGAAAGPSTGRTLWLARHRLVHLTRRPVVRALAVALLLGAVGAGIWTYRGSQATVDGTDGRVVAVLPFENLGDSADAYFTDGVANDVRAKLAEVRGLAVIARASSIQYRQSTKPPQEIARELGADYLLTATVQWEKIPGGASRVRVTPELVDARPGHSPQARWGHQFDAALTEVFQVQTDIAEEVAQALNVALGDSTRRDLARRPTSSLPAYDAFLRGEEASEHMTAFAPASLRQAITAYEQAVALDSTFAEAWARIASAQAQLYYNSEPSPAKAEGARQAAERAVALAPGRPEGHVARGWYYADVLFDNRRAYGEDSIALTLAPDNIDVLVEIAWNELSLARWNSAREHLERGIRLDPRSSDLFALLGYVLLATKQYKEAERAYDHALGLTPDNLNYREFRTMVALAEGDVEGARAVLRATPKSVDPTTLVAYMAQYGDLYWLFDEGQLNLLLRLSPSAFDGNRATWAWVRAESYALKGDTARARAYADTALKVYRGQLADAPNNAELHVRVGLAEAWLGMNEAAIRDGERGVKLQPLKDHAADGAVLQHQLVRIYIAVGEQEKALDALEPLLHGYILSPAWLSIDPTFDPLGRHPRFQRLTRGST